MIYPCILPLAVSAFTFMMVLAIGIRIVLSAQRDAANEIERLRAELQVIATTPAGPSGRTGNEMYFQRRAEAALAMNLKEPE